MYPTSNPEDLGSKSRVANKYTCSIFSLTCNLVGNMNTSIPDIQVILSYAHMLSNRQPLGNAFSKNIVDRYND